MRHEDEIELVIEGPGIKPGTIDPFLALDLARAYLDLLRKIAEEANDDLGLLGLETRRGSFVLAARSRNPQLARTCAHRASRLVDLSIEAPPPLHAKVEKLRGVLLKFPAGVTAQSRVAGATEPLLTVATATDPGVPESVDLRALVIGAWGQDQPFAEFASPSEERPFTLRVSKSEAAALGRNLYGAVDLCATVTRDERGNIQRGKLDEFTPVEEGDSLASWQEWFRSAGAGWSDVTDIEGDLGRD